MLRKNMTVAASEKVVGLFVSPFCQARNIDARLYSLA